MKTQKLSFALFLMLFTSLVAQDVTNLELKQYYGNDVTDGAVVGIAQDPYTGNIFFNAEWHVGVIDLNGNHLNNFNVGSPTSRVFFEDQSAYAILSDGTAETKTDNLEWTSNFYVSGQHFQTFNPFIAGVKNNDTFWMCSGTLSRSTSKAGGLFEFDSQSALVASYTIINGQFPANQIIVCLLDSIRNQLWIGTDLGLLVFDFNTKTSEWVIKDGYCNSLAWSYDKTEILTVVEYDQKYENTPTFFKVNPDSRSFSIESGNEVGLSLCKSIAEDRFGNYFFANGRDAYKELPPGEVPLVILSNENWFRLDDDFNVIPYHQMTDRTVHPTGGLFSLTIAEDEKIWAGGLNGIYVLDYGTSAVEEVVIDSQPEGFTLSKNYPNPFNPQTSIEFSLPKSQHVNLTVFDINGRAVKVLVDEFRSVGIYQVRWVPEPDVPSGTYLFYLITETRTSVVKTIFIK
ncbi:T9SS type A sorting domain-containing protein [bacterium]|nr:T9SS type A sorting domain-containing protein [bacterium]